MAALALVVERAAQSVRFKIEMKAADVTGRLDKVMSILVGLAAAPGELFEGEFQLRKRQTRISEWGVPK